MVGIQLTAWCKEDNCGSLPSDLCIICTTQRLTLCQNYIASYALTESGTQSIEKNLTVTGS